MGTYSRIDGLGCRLVSTDTISAVFVALVFLAASGIAAPANPVVTVGSPQGGATVSRTITVAANATSSVGMSNVQFQLDGVVIGSPVPGVGPAFVMSWDST